MKQLFSLTLLLLLLLACTPVKTATPTPTITAVSSPAATKTPKSTTVPTTTPIPATPTVPLVPPTETAVSPSDFFNNEAVAPYQTEKLETGQTIWFERDDAIWRTNIDGLQPEQISSNQFLGRNTDEVDYRDTQPKLSPNGRFIVQLYDHETTKLLDIATNLEIILPAMWEFDWSPDSRYLAYVPVPINQESTHPIFVYDVFTNNSIRVVGQDRGRADRLFHRPVWSPDGKQLAFACCFVPSEPYDGSNVGELQQVEVASGSRETVGEVIATVAGGVAPICWHEGNIINSERENALRCDSNFTYSLFSDTSKNNMHAMWQTINNENGEWRGTQIIVTNATNEEVWTLDWEEATPLALAWSLDGRFLFFSDQSNESSIWRIDADSNNLIEFLPNAKLLGVVAQWQKPEATSNTSPDG